MSFHTALVVIVAVTLPDLSADLRYVPR